MISWEPADCDTAVGVVTLSVARRQREPLPKPSQKAFFVYSYAMVFFEHGDSMREAIPKGEKWWERLARGVSSKGADIPVVDDGEGDVVGAIQLESRDSIDVKL